MVTYSAQSSRERELSFTAASRRAMSSAWQEGSELRSALLCARETIRSSFTTTAPTGEPRFHERLLHELFFYEHIPRYFAFFLL